MTVPAIVVSGEGLERNLERPRLERNWSGHRLLGLPTIKLGEFLAAEIVTPL